MNAEDEEMMGYVIAAPCVGVKDAACVNICPVDCIYDAGIQFVIDPDECIDCGACVSECPVDAIFGPDDLPEKWENYRELNKNLAALAKP